MNNNDTPTPQPTVRPATQAGRFYEGDAQTLREEVDQYLARHADEIPSANVAALIVPHAGYYYSANVAATAYMNLDPAHHFKRVFLIGPSHYEWLGGASVNSEADYYATPLGHVAVDRDTARQLMAADNLFAYHRKAHDREHCLEVQLPFLQRRLTDVPPIVPIIVSTNSLAHLRRMAEALQPYFNDENLFVISSDFSHYPSYKDACQVDAKTGEAILSGDVERFIDVMEENEQSGVRNLSTSACGAFPIIILLTMLQNGGKEHRGTAGSRYTIKHLIYENSGDIETADRRRVVGYHAFAILRNTSTTTDKREDTDSDESSAFTLTDSDKQQLKALARESIRTAFAGKDIPSPASPSPTLDRKCGAFVTLTQQGRLRGCIGHFGEDIPLREMVAEMARAAAFEDPRFPRLRREELDSTDIEISVLTPMRRIHSLDEFQLHHHGIYIKKGFRSGTFLPQVADEVPWTKEEFVAHCSRDKAGLGWDGWRNAELYVYEAIVF